MKEWSAAVALTASVLTPDVSVAFIGVPLNVLVACVLGTYSGFCVGDPIVPRPRMWRLAVACVFMGGAFTAIANAAIIHWVHLEMTPGLQAGVGAAISFCTKFFLPWLADVVSKGKWIGWLPFLNKRIGE